MFRDVVVVSPFRKPNFRLAVSAAYPLEEPWDSPPFLTAGAIEAAGFDTAYLPLQNTFTSYLPSRDSGTLKTLLEGHQSRIVLFSCDHFVASRSTAGIYGLQIVSDLLRELPNHPIVGATGRLATTLSSKLLEFVPGLDFVIVGESDTIVGEIICAILRHGLSGIAHQSFITRNAAAVSSSEPVFVADLNSTPMPAFHLVSDALEICESVTGREMRNIPFSIRTSAGCKFACKFCAGVPYWNTYRTKSAERVGAELDSLSNHGTGRARLAFLEDEIFTLDIDHVLSVCGMLNRRGIVLDGVYTHSSLLTESAAQALSPVTHRVFLGLDNPDDSILKSLGKGQTLATLVNAIRIATESNLKVHLEWIIGTPPEDVNSLIGSLNSIFVFLATGAVESINTYVFCAHPGTAYGHLETYRIDEYEQMLESGGFPMGRYSTLTSNQVFVAYLISQILIHEAILARGTRHPTNFSETLNAPALRDMFALVGKDSLSQVASQAMPI